jgi:hypothetical protein
MSVKINRSGLNKLIKNIKEMEGTHQVKLTDILHPAFVSAHSTYSDLEALFKASGFKIDTPEDFKAVPDDQWDDFIKTNTDFENWSEMQKAGHREYVAAQLHKGI